MAKAEGQSAEQGIQLAIEAMLVSPNFLFRMEHDPDPLDAAKTHPVSEVELASRLSYFLWSSMPDDELLRLAESRQASRARRARRAGEAHDGRSEVGGVRRQFRRPVAGDAQPRFRQARSARSSPRGDPELRDAMKTETRMFFESVLRENRPISDFLDAKYTFLNERLAKHYGIDGVTGPEFRRVELTDRSARRHSQPGQRADGVELSHPDVARDPRQVHAAEHSRHAAAAASARCAGARRSGGRQRRVACGSRWKSIAPNAVCASCHSRMDVLGFGLENYDAIGKWRTMDGKFPDRCERHASRTARSFASPAEMTALLMADLPEFSRCLTEKMLTYALGRGLRDATTAATVDEIESPDWRRPATGSRR